MAKIKEIFTSVQGEGPFVGYKQLFVRFCGCNLDCHYCDTDFDTEKSKDYSVEDLIKLCNENIDCHSISLTGGEPLLHIDFLKDFLPECPLPVYLETNGVLYNNLEEVIKWTTYISADIKLPSSTNMKPFFTEHDKFFKTASSKILFAKAVFTEKITKEEIKEMCLLCKKYNIELILQPMMKENTLTVSSDFMQKTLDKALKLYHKVRLIPQTHKFLNID